MSYAFNFRFRFDGGGAMTNPGGSDGQIQFNDGNAFGGMQGSSFDTADQALGLTFNGPNSGVEINPADSGLSTNAVFSPTSIAFSGVTGPDPALEISSGGALGFFAATPIAKPTVTGVKLPSDTVMASLLTALKNLGLITDSTT